MFDFKIYRALHDELFPPALDGELNPNLAVEPGCWYLCTDTADLFLGVQIDGSILTLKHINDNRVPAVENLVQKHEFENVKQVVTQEVIPGVEEVKTWVENKEYLQDIDLAGYATEKWVADQKFAKLIDVPQTENFATKTFVHELVGDISVPEVPTQLSAFNNDVNFVTADTANSLFALKANKVLFTTSKIVTKPLGDFAEGEDIINLTLSELFAKLLGLSSGTSPSNTPIRDSIINNHQSMYQADDEGLLVKVPYESIQFTEEAALLEPVRSGFYEISDSSGSITEYGYQHITEPQNMFYMIAIPNSIILGKNADLMTWDVISSAWVDCDTSTLTSDAQEIEQVLEENGIASPASVSGYTLWVDLNEVNPGRKYRIIIKEGEQ